MTFVQSVRTCFAKFFDFRSRASRAEFWWFSALVVPAFLAVEVMAPLLLGVFLFGPLGTFVECVILFPWVAAGYRRLHDVDLPGWPVLIPVAMTLLSEPLFLMMWFVMGDAGPPSGTVGVLANVLGFAYLVVGWGTFPAWGIVAILLARPGTEGQNRYGM